MSWCLVCWQINWAGFVLASKALRLANASKHSLDQANNTTLLISWSLLIKCHNCFIIHNVNTTSIYLLNPFQSHHIHRHLSPFSETSSTPCSEGGRKTGPYPKQLSSALQRAWMTVAQYAIVVRLHGELWGVWNSTSNFKNANKYWYQNKGVSVGCVWNHTRNAHLPAKQTNQIN